MPDVPTLLGRLAPTQPFDATEFGDVDVQPLSQIQKLTGAFLGRNWVTVPHVTHHDEIDVTKLEAWRRQRNEAAGAGEKLTLLPILVKRLAAVLGEFPHFNASLSDDGESLIVKRYVNIGVAVDTPRGLLVPVIRDVDSKSEEDVAAELSAIANKARQKGLTVAEMSGGSFSVSSLGHVGGTAFTPIINVPDVAILGITRIQERPTRGKDDTIEWRSMLPLSLSYDHRVINGADAAQFVRRLGERVSAYPELQQRKS